ncbi:MAG: cytochrome b N-terminal domain-containing protein [Deltaproteobacteria bacterium]|nr:cytochrome b N-terminal domain-containing protein [Deltaproteobacteria bacterium]
MSERRSFADALDARFGHRRLMQELLEDHVVGGARWSYAIGAALTVLLVMQGITGVGLMMVYAPSSQTAWASVHYVTHRLPWGWLLRGVHHYASDALLALSGLHLARTALVGAYRGHRDVNWWVGLVLMGLTFALAITGGRLVWDQAAYWAFKVEANITATTPIVGGALARLAQGGPQLGHFTLTRMYALHVAVLPMLVIATVALHARLRRVHGHAPVGDPGKVSPRAVQLQRDAIVAVAVVALVVALAVRAHGAPLDAPADPNSEYPARPEWFLLPLYELRRLLSGGLEAVATMVIPSIAIAFLVLLPVLDRKRDASLRARGPFLGALGLGALGGALLVLSAKRHDARDAKFQKARAAADERAAYAIELAKAGVPPEGPLEMLARDPKIRGEEIWKKECATCHTLDGKLTDEKEAAADVKGWGTAAWVESMVRDPDDPLRFGRSPFKGEMPSATKPPPGKEAEFKPMSEADVKAVSEYVAAQGKGGSTDAHAAQVFDDACGGCHELNGKGGDDSDLAPKLTGWGSYRWLRAQIADPTGGETYDVEAGHTKYKGRMPAFSKDLGPDVDVIARWLWWRLHGSWPTEAQIAAAAAPPAPAASSAPPAASSAAAISSASTAAPK